MKDYEGLQRIEKLLKNTSSSIFLAKKMMESANDLDEMKALMKSKDAIEGEILMLTEDLSSPGLNGEAPACVKGSLIDSEGFPRADIDIYQVKYKRQRLNVLQTDHLEIMSKIEACLKSIHKNNKNSSVMKDISNNEENIKSVRVSTTKRGDEEGKGSSDIKVEKELEAFALVDEVSIDSPAKLCGLEIGDKILQFGSIQSNNHRNLLAIADVVRENINKEIEIRITRGDVSIKVLRLKPIERNGRGYLGCHIVPLSLF